MRLLVDLPLVKRFSVNASARHEDVHLYGSNRTWCTGWTTRAVLLLLACAAFGSVAMGDEIGASAGVLAEAVAQNPIAGPAAGSLSGRPVRLDPRAVRNARAGETLRLDLLGDAVFDVRVNQVRATPSGRHVYGDLAGSPGGKASLVVNGDLMVGEVTLSTGQQYMIRPTASGGHVVRQVDASSSYKPGHAHPVSPMLSSTTTAVVADDSAIDILFLYTPAVRNVYTGGDISVDLIAALWVATAQLYLTHSGADAVLRHVGSEMINYTEPDVPLSDHYRLTEDVVAVRRNHHAADLVVLLVDRRAGDAAGTSFVETMLMAFEGGTVSTFAHELGHFLGLMHDRYQLGSVLDSLGIEPVLSGSYHYGYVNQKQFEAGAGNESRWRTIMAYSDQCSDSGWTCPKVPRFSNPNQTWLGDALGAPLTESEDRTSGPAYAALEINENWRQRARTRTRACQISGVSSANFVVGHEATELSVMADAAENCVWEATSGAAFLTVYGPRHNSGNDSVRIKVDASGGRSARTGTLSVGGRTITVVQDEVSAGLCSRTPQVSAEITRQAGFADQAECRRVTNEHLGSITSLDLEGNGISVVCGDDFVGLRNLEELDLSDNRLATLPAGVFDGLSRLRTLDLGTNQLSTLPATVFRNLSRLEDLHLSDNRIEALATGLFDGLAALRSLELGNNNLRSLGTDPFGGLSALQRLGLRGNELTRIDAGTFDELLSLDRLDLRNAGIEVLSPGAFAGLSALGTLDLRANRLSSLPAMVFRDLSRLESLSLSGNLLNAVPSGLFEGLSKLRVLSLSGNPGADFRLVVGMALPEPGKFRIRVPVGAPLDIDVPVTLTNGRFVGPHDGVVGAGSPENARTITVPAGATESAVIVTARRDGTTGPIIAEIGTLPTPPQALPFEAISNPLEITHHDGYTLAKAVGPVILGDPAATGICDHTAQVRTAILAAIPEVDDCASVTDAHLAQIQTLFGSDKSIRALKSGDFAGLSSLTALYLQLNQIETLPPEVFAGLERLTLLRLESNRLESLPIGIFDGLSSLTFLTLSRNALTDLRADVFSKLPALEHLDLTDNSLAALPPGVFDGLSLRKFSLRGNQIASRGPDGDSRSSSR